MRPDSVMLFAAGFGTRMGALTANRPKPMLEVAGKPLIDHALDLVRHINPGTVVANVHYLPDQIRSHLDGRNILISDESGSILETGGGLRKALPLLGDGPVITMNTDAVWHGENPLEMLQAAWDPAKMDGLLMCIPLQNAIGHAGDGDFVLDNTNRLSRGPGHVYSGVQILKTDLLDRISEESFSLNRVWDLMLDQDRLFGMSYPGQWCDVGHPEGIVLAEQMIGYRHV